MTRLAVVLGVTGAQQAAIATHFAEAGWTIRGTSRKAVRTPFGPTVPTDLDNNQELVAALKDADVAIFTLPQDHTPGVTPRIASKLAAAARTAGVRKLVVNMAATVDADAPQPLFADMRSVRDAALGSGVPTVVLEPTVFMDNLRAPWSLPAIVNDGVFAYPTPPGIRVSWISHRSLAAFVAAAASDPAVVGRSIRIGGPQALTTGEMCAILGRKLGRPVTYQQIPLEGFAAGIDQAFGPPAGQRIASIYGRLNEKPGLLSVDPANDASLGVSPESFEDFVQRHDWTAA